MSSSYYLYFTAIYFLISSPLNAQKENIEALVNQYIHKTTDYGQLRELVGTLDGKVEQYLPIFEKIPCIRPINPENKQNITSTYGFRFHPIDQKTEKHHGIDIAASMATTVHATAPGTVKKLIFSHKGYGNHIILEHAYGYESKYAHLSIIMVLKVGQQVKLGQIIGFVGSTGKSTGNHLHYEIIKNNKSIDPLPSFTLRRDLLERYKKAWP